MLRVGSVVKHLPHSLSLFVSHDAPHFFERMWMSSASPALAACFLTCA